MHRYSAETFNQSLLKLGGIRIGTLHDFRKSEHKKGIADPQEGKKDISHHIESALVNSVDDMHGKAAKEFKIFDAKNSSASMYINNVTFLKRFNEPDCFILCLSSKLSIEVMAEFEGANSCVKILNPNLFLSVLTGTLNSITPVIFRGAHKVIYQDKKEDWNGHDWGKNPALIKEEEFKKQHEIRMIWQPRFNQTITPVILFNYRLGTVCRKMAI